MNAWIRDSQTGKSLYAIAMLLALYLRILIPAGYMPTFSAQGIVVELCSGESGKTIIIDLGSKPENEKQKHAADSPCVFAAGLGHTLLTHAAPLYAPPAIYGGTVVGIIARARFAAIRLAAPPPPAQGPPSLF